MQNLMIAYTLCFLINAGVYVYLGPQIMQIIQQAQEQAVQKQNVPPIQVPAK